MDVSIIQNAWLRRRSLKVSELSDAKGPPESEGSAYHNPSSRRGESIITLASPRLPPGLTARGDATGKRVYNGLECAIWPVHPTCSAGAQPVHRPCTARAPLVHQSCPIDSLSRRPNKVLRSTEFAVTVTPLGLPMSGLLGEE